MNGTISPDSIRQLAYELWEQRGRQGGNPHDDWCQAEEILANQHRAATAGAALEQVTGAAASASVDEAVEESFPASDPPAVSGTDEPPVNAGDKWRAAKAAKNGRRNNHHS